MNNFASTISKKLSVLAFIVSIILSGQVFSQSSLAELVVSAGYSFPNEASFSKDGRMIATIHTSDVIKVWDVKTGRELRSLVYKLENLLTKADSCWFTDDNLSLMVNLTFSNDLMKFDLNTKNMTYIKSDVPYDYAKMHYSRMFKSATNLSVDKKTITETAPDGVHQILFEHFITRDKWKFDHYRLVLKNKTTGKRIVLPDSTTYGFSAITNDSKYVFVGSKIYDFETGKTVCEFQSTAYTPFSVAFLPRAHTAVTCGMGGVRIWDFPNVHDAIKGHVVGFYPTKDYKKMVCDIYDGTGTKRVVKIANMDSIKEIDSSAVSSNKKIISGISENAEQFVTFEYKADIKVSDKEMWGGANYEVLLNNITKKTKDASFISGDSYFMPGSQELFLKEYTSMYGGDSTFKTYNIKKKSFGKMKLQGWSSGYIIGQSLNKKYIFNNTIDSGWVKQKLNVWELPSGKLAKSIVFKGQMSSAHEVNANESMIAFATNQGNAILIYSFIDGKLLHTLQGHNAYVFSVAFSEDNKRLLSASYDGTKKLWDLETGKEILTMVDIGEDDYAIVTPDQYYYCTKGATKYIHFVKDMKVYPFEQFDLKFNRPDIIMQRIGSTNIELEKSYKYAHEKRIKKMGFTEDQLSGEMHLPVVEIKNSASLPPNTNAESISVSVSAKDDKFKLDRMFVRVNGIPMGGVNGISVKDKKTNTIAEEIKIQLASGKNKIEVSVMNEAGAESIAETFEILNTKEVGKPSLYIVTIGVSKYSDKKFNLNYASKDAENMLSLFKQDTLFKNVNELVLNNESATLTNEMKIKSFIEKATINDHVIVFVAGHGVLDANLNYYLANHDMDFSKPEQTGLAYEKLEDMLNGIASMNKLLLIDACHSGEVDKEEVMLVANTSNAVKEEGDVKFRSITGTSVKRIGLNNSFEMMKELFTDIRKGNGTVVISSAGGAEYAMEGAQWNNGVFTYCLLKGLRELKADYNHDKKIMVSELQKYLQLEVQRLTGGKQKPTSRSENLSNDWRVW